MNKYLLFFMLLAGTVNAQFTKLFDFDGVNGSSPFGSAVPSADNSVLYGMTNGGGTLLDNNGVVYSVNSDGTNFQTLHTFTEEAGSGKHPYGSIIRSGNVLYGMTSGGGDNSAGIIFSINTNGNDYTKLHDFGVTVDSGSMVFGGNPNGTLVLSGNTLYGTTHGSPGDGTVFSINTNGTNFTTLHSFNNTDGMYPGYGALALSGNTLFGTTLYGGANGNGVLFSINTNGSGFDRLIDFNTVDGQMPYGSVICVGNKLYGNTGGGGLYTKGTVYSVNTDGTGYQKLHDFTGADGQGPMGDLVLVGGTLYGTTGGGGTYNLGTIFSIDTSGSGFQSVFSFNTPNGTQPRAQLSVGDGILYGTCVIGGTYDDGTVFSYEIQPSGLPVCMVTVDSTSTHNIIVWEKPVTTEIDSFIVFRETTSNTYKQIGAKAYAELSEFTDTVSTSFFPFTGNPNAGANRYKIQVRYVSGEYSLLSPYHNTMFITNNSGTFTWNHYAVENDAVPLPSVSAYILYRDDNATGDWHAVQGVSASQNSITDPDYAFYPNGNWRVETDWSVSCVSTAKTYTASISNASDFVIPGIEQPDKLKVTVYPNPGHNTITVQTDFEKGIYQLNDITGKTLLQGTAPAPKITLDISNLSSGVYFISVTDGERQVNGKVVKQ